jgi:hypothetical protein
MGAGNDPSYSSSRTFETFPFPWAPGEEPKADPGVQAIAQAAKELVEQRDRWLNATPTTHSPSGRGTSPGSGEAGRRSKRTLTNLRLDEAVFAAYGWKSDLSDEEILEKLLALNLERAK